MNSQSELNERCWRGEVDSAAKDWPGKKLQTPSTTLQRNIKLQKLEVAG
jgi:hypothetical protein